MGIEIQDSELVIINSTFSKNKTGIYNDYESRLFINAGTFSENGDRIRNEDFYVNVTNSTFVNNDKEIDFSEEGYDSSS